MLFDLTGITLAARKIEARQEIDAAAEAARLLWITPGAAQAQEYRRSEEQARAYKAAAYPTPFDAAAQATYSMVHAEVLARADAGLISIATQTELDAAAHTAADDIIAEADAWVAASKTIRRYRRAAKLKVSEATTFAQIHAALQIAWPTP